MITIKLYHGQPPGAESSGDAVISVPCGAKLTVTKVVINDNGGTNVASDWTLFIDGSPVPQGTPISVLPGTHTVTETGPSGYTGPTFSGDCDSSGKVTVAAGQNKSCTVTNDDQPATINVTKKVFNDNGGTAVASDFTLRIDGTATSSAVVNAGSHTVSEDDPSPAYDGSISCDNGASSSGISVTFSVSNGQVVNCTVTNDDQPATINVTKKVFNDNGGTAVASDFTLRIDGTATSSAVVNAGSHTVSEDDPSPAYDGSISCDNGASSSGISVTFSVSNGQVVNCTITNDDVQPLLTVTKVVINNNGGTATVGDFHLQVDGTPVTSGVQQGFNAGTYAVGESGPSGYTATFSGDCDESGLITLAIGDVKSCTVTNDDQPAQLIVIKHVINDHGGTNVAGDWTISVSGGKPSPASFPGSEAGTTVTLDAGSYSVSESGPSGYTRSDSSDCSGTIANGQSKTCTITNDDQPATIFIVKNSVGGDDTFTFAISGPTSSVQSISTVGGVGASGAITVSAGSYTVTEIGLPLNWTQTGASCGGTGTSFVLPLGGSITCVFENTIILQVGQLILQVQVKDKNATLDGGSDTTRRCPENKVPQERPIIQVGEETTVELFVISAPDGLASYDLLFRVGSDIAASQVARIEKIESRTIEKEFFEIVDQRDFFVRFKAQDRNDHIQIGDSCVVFAEVTLRGLLPGPSVLNLFSPGTTVISDLGQLVQRPNLVVIPEEFEVR